MIFGLAFVRQGMDKTLRYDDVGRILGHLVLSLVPRPSSASQGTSGSRSIVAFNQGISLPAGAFRAPRPSIFFAELEGNGTKKLGVTRPRGPGR